MQILSKHYIMEQAELSKDYSDWVDQEGDGLYGLHFMNLDWSGIALPDVDFNMLEAFDCTFDNASLQRVSFVHARIYRCSFRGADLTGSDFYEAEVDDANLEGACLFRADLSKASLLRAKGREANFEEAECGANLSAADLSGAKFARANLDRTRFAGAILCEADFRFANFGRWGSCEGADFTGANLTGARIPVNRLAQALNIDQVVADWIIVSDEYDTRYIGERAHAWLQEQAALPIPPFRHPRQIDSD